MRTSRGGFTLVEMLIVVGVVGMLGLIGFPKVQSALRKAQLRSARNAVINLYQQARTRAINENRQMTLNMDGTSVWVTGSPRRTGAAACNCDTIGTVQDIAGHYGVALAGGNYTVDARGLGTTPGTDLKIVFTKSGVRDSFTITGYGRISK
jgi:prepilin-type N-terminal cleavage/methylation domain-containing protein